MPRRKSPTKDLFWGFKIGLGVATAFVVVLGILAVLTGWSPFQTIAPPSGGVQTISGVQETCSIDSGGYSVTVAYKNVENDSVQYLSANVYIFDSTDQPSVASGTTSAATSESSAGVNLNTQTCEKGKVLTVLANPTSSLVGVMGTFKAGEHSKVILQGAASAIPAVTVYAEGSWTSNISQTDDTDGTITLTSAISVGESDTVSRNMKVRMTTSDSQFGGTKNGEAILIGWHNPDKTVFDNSDLMLDLVSGGAELKQVDCSDYKYAYENLDLDVCYVLTKAIGDRTKEESNALGSTFKFEVTINPTKGDPGASDDPVLYFVDLHNYYDQALGKVIFDGYDSEGNDIGETNVQVTFDLS